MDASASTAAMTLSGAAVAGIVSQSVARSLNVPGIVLLLAVGVLLGPDVAGVIEPKTLGSALPEVVGFAVAVILFEGGMHLADDLELKSGDTVYFAARLARADVAMTWLPTLGWQSA